MALYSPEAWFGPAFAGGDAPAELLAAAMASFDIQASTRVPPQAAWMSAVGRLEVCIRAMSRAVRKHTAEKLARKVLGRGDFGSLPGCSFVACSTVSHWLQGSASQAMAQPSPVQPVLGRSHCGVGA